MKNIIIEVGKSESLSAVVQELLFKNGAARYRYSPYDKVQLTNYPFIGVNRNVITVASSATTFDFKATRVNAATEFGKLLELLSEEEVKIKMTGDYSATVGPTHVDFGEFKLTHEVVRRVAKAIEDRRKLTPVKLNNSYTAEVGDAVTVVGCQVIDNKNILALAEEINKK